LKQRRSRVRVPVPPYGVVADYVPFYLAPRSPMLFANLCGNVADRPPGQEGIVYLVTTIERVGSLEGVVLTSKHPVMRPEFTEDLARFDDSRFIDWDVMFDRVWTSETDTERPERRQAEVLVHESVPLEAVLGIACRTSHDLQRARQACQSGMPDWHFKVRADWYF